LNSESINGLLNTATTKKQQTLWQALQHQQAQTMKQHQVDAHLVNEHPYFLAGVLLYILLLEGTTGCPRCASSEVLFIMCSMLFSVSPAVSNFFILNVGTYFSLTNY